MKRQIFFVLWTLIAITNAFAYNLPSSLVSIGKNAINKSQTTTVVQKSITYYEKSESSISDKLMFTKLKNSIAANENNNLASAKKVNKSGKKVKNKNKSKRKKSARLDVAPAKTIMLGTKGPKNGYNKGYGINDDRRSSNELKSGEKNYKVDNSNGLVIY